MIHDFIDNNNEFIIYVNNYVIRCKLADFGLARSLSQNHQTVESNGNEEACLTDYVGKASSIVMFYIDITGGKLSCI